MNVIIFGSEGFVGNNIYQSFSKENRCCCADVKTIEKGYYGGNKYYIQLDSEQPDYEGAINHFASIWGDIDVCINASGSANVLDSFMKPYVDSVMNYINVEKMLEAIRVVDPKIKYITLSSAAVYGNPLSLPVLEDEELFPISPYGYHKLCSERICEMYNKLFGINTYVLRLFSVYGIGQKKLLLWDLVNKFLKNTVVELSGTGHESRDYISVRDVTNVISLFVSGVNETGEAIASGCYNVANGKQIFISEVAEMVQSAMDCKKKIVFNGENRKGDPINWEADISKIKSLGYKQEVSIEEGIREYVNWAISEVC